MARALAANLGMNSESNPRTTQGTAAANDTRRDWPVAENGKDYYVTRDGVQFAGTHLLIDLWEASRLDNIELVEDALRRSAIEAGATILHCHLHHFQPNGGISGVLVLAESHISIHTWPERDFAAIDVFMCGGCNPYHGVPALKAAFAPSSINLGEQRRGLIA